MNKKEFLEFCKKEFYKRGYKKVKRGYYLEGEADILSAIFLIINVWMEEFLVVFCNKRYV